MVDTRLTNNTHETSFGEILKERSYFRIPPFQREYKWKQQRLDQLITDVNRVKDEEEEAHFLGAFIIDALPKDPNAPGNYEVIDGQQRITTFYLLIAGAVRTLLKEKHVELASEYALDYLFTREGTTTLRSSLIPSIPDQGDLNSVHEDLWAAGLGTGLAAYKLEKLPIATANQGRVIKNYEALRRYTSNVYKAEGVEGLKQFVTAAQAGLTVVQILVKDPTSGPKIFDSLNSKQEPMTTGDLVRNEVFSKVAREDPLKAQALDTHLWQPFYASFQREKQQTFEGFFFPFGLIQDPGFKKSEVYNGLRKMWSSKTPKEVMSELEAYRLEYQDLVFGENHCNSPKDVAEAVLRLARFDFPRVALPFLMQVMHSVRTGELKAVAGVDLLTTIECFLVRRALCSLEPTGLHTVFKKLWKQLEDDYSGAHVRELIAQAKTVSIPSDEDVVESFARPLYGKNVAKFFLFEYDRGLGGDPGDFANMWIEHVFPRTYHEHNWGQFSRKDHEALANLAGNLIPLSKEMNVEVGQAPIAEKSKTYLADSYFKSAREFAKEHTTWDPEQLLARNAALAGWAVQRWRF